MKYVIALIAIAVQVEATEKYKSAIDGFKAGHKGGYLTSEAEKELALSALHNPITVAELQKFDVTGDGKVNFFEFAKALGHNRYFDNEDLRKFFMAIKTDKGITLTNQLSFLKHNGLTFDEATMAVDVRTFVQKTEEKAPRDNTHQLTFEEFVFIMTKEKH